MGDPSVVLRLAAVQAAPVFLDREKTTEKACRLIREAGAGGAQFVGFPENFIPGHPIWMQYHAAMGLKSRRFAVELYKNSVEIPGPETDALCQAAADARAFVVVGLTERRPNQTGTLFNTQLFIDKSGTIVGKHQKLVPTMFERVVHAVGSGSTLRTFPSEFGPVSGLICGENSNPMAVSVLAVGYTRIHVASWPNTFGPGATAEGSGMREVSRVTAASFAYACKCFVVSSCSTLGPEIVDLMADNEADRAFMEDPANSGGSVIVDPRGCVIAGPMPGDREGLLYADADLDLTIAARFSHDFGGHYNRPDVFRLIVNDTDVELVTRVRTDLSGALVEPQPLAEILANTGDGLPAEPADRALGAAGRRMITTGTPAPEPAEAEDAG